jgi:Protein of unknown function (DUF3768)
MTVERIRDLNDRFRRTFEGGGLLSQAVSSLPGGDVERLIKLVKEFEVFTSDNDPHGEHDFGAIELNGERYFWKIDYYDLQRQLGSPDPAHPMVTVRKLTIMRADEY